MSEVEKLIDDVKSITYDVKRIFEIASNTPAFEEGEDLKKQIITFDESLNRIVNISERWI